MKCYFKQLIRTVLKTGRVVGYERPVTFPLLEENICYHFESLASIGQQIHFPPVSFVASL